MSILPPDLGRIPASDTTGIHRIEAKQEAKDFAGKEEAERRFHRGHAQSEEELPQDAVDLSEEYLSSAHGEPPAVGAEDAAALDATRARERHLDIEV